MPRDKLTDLIKRHAITLKAHEYYFGRKKLSKIELILPAGYEGTEWILLPREALEQLEKELRLTELTLRLCYGKYLSAAFYKELKDQLSLDEKIELSYRVIEEALRVMKTHCKSQVVAVAFSGGKASTVTLKLVVDVLQQCDPDLLKEKFIVYYNDTGNEFPENTPYVIEFVKKYLRLPKLVIVRPKLPQLKPFVIWRTFGFPPESRYHYREPVCCMLLKKLPAILTIIKYNVDLRFLGLQVFESRGRLAMLERTGLLTEHSCIGHICLDRWFYECAPVAFWSESDIWMYIERENLPVNPVYDRYGIDRQGCMFCTNHMGWDKRIRHVLVDVLKRPQTWEWFMKVYRQWGVQKERVTLLKALERLGLLDLIRKWMRREGKLKDNKKKLTIREILPYLERLYVFKEL